jgi:hypothetical protein
MSGDIKYKEAYRKGNYILNHYSRSSYADKLCLSRSLHTWALKYAKIAANTIEGVALQPATAKGMQAQKDAPATV